MILIANYREIVTKAVIGKGKKRFINHHTMTLDQMPTTILGCWVINHTFNGTQNGETITVNGTCDVNIWYSYNNDRETKVSKDTISYTEQMQVHKNKESDTGADEIIVRSLRNPNCTKIEIKDGKIEYDIEKELGVEIVGDSKMRIEVDDNEDEWEDLNEEKNPEKELEDIDESIQEEFIKEEK